MTRRAALATSAGLAAAFMVLAATMLAGGTVALDAAVRSGAQAVAHPLLTTVLVELSHATEPVWLAVAAGVVALTMWRRQRHRAVTVLVGMGGALVLTWTLKPLFGRARPEPLWDYLPVSTHAFPSSHALVSLVFFSLMAWLVAGITPGTTRRAVLAGAALLVALVCLARVYLGAHHASDVLAGVLAGSAWLAALAAWRGEAHAACPVPTGLP